MYLNLRRQPGYRPVSSKVGDHLRILLGVVVHLFLLFSQRSRAGALQHLSLTLVDVCLAVCTAICVCA